MSINSILVNSKDNVCVATVAFKKGETACYQDGDTVREVVLVTDVPIYHKYARVPIQKDENIVKYGQVIGAATCDVPAGTHIHTQNVRSLRQLF